MAEQRSTPEEKLLKLIEKEDNNESVIFKRKKNVFSIFSGFWFFIQRIISQFINGVRNGVKEPNLKVLNRLFLVASICLLSFSVMDFVINRPNVQDAYKEGKRAREDNKEGSILSKGRPFLHYLEMVQRRNIFSPIELKQEEEDPKVQEKQLQEMVSKWGLVGISFDNEPMAMIEDKAAKKTYFLKKGDNIGEFKIEGIYENKVVLSYEDNTVELI
ncbi:MAG: hypothetical protein RAP41_03865 [Candidatus Orphnella occulta]|nr:hypothetical protein [Candidatus Orphnella occulta]